MSNLFRKTKHYVLEKRWKPTKMELKLHSKAKSLYTYEIQRIMPTG